MRQTEARANGNASRLLHFISGGPVSTNDDRLRRDLYRAVYDFNSPLHRYGVGSRQAIHIVVKDGRTTLKGVVDSESDKQLAYTKARGVAGLFGVDNELRVDGERRMMRETESGPFREKRQSEKSQPCGGW